MRADVGASSTPAAGGPAEPSDHVLQGPFPPPVTARKAPLPILPGSGREVLPALALWWGFMLGLLFGLDERLYLGVGLVGTPTLVMLWPVGRSLGRRYLSYRPLPWVAGIITMWIIPTAGIVLAESGWSFDTKSAIFFSLPPIIAFGGILVALPWAQARPPIRMLFRPDLLFGDGRTLVGGTLLLVIGIRYLFAGHPADQPWAIPAWNWYSFAWGIGLGVIPIVLMRGMLKYVQRLFRLRDGMFTGWPSLAVREWILLLFGLNFGFAFHHVFMGRTVFSTIGEPGQFPITSQFWAGWGLMAAAAWWLLLVKGGFKKLIGEPFFFESFLQTVQKQLVFVVGWAVFFYGLMSVLNGGAFGRIQPWDDQTAAGLGFFLTGILVLTLGRAVAQHYQRQGFLAHFAGVILPSQADRARERLMLRILEGMARLSPRRRDAAWLTMHRAWDGIDPDERSLMAWTTLTTLLALDDERRQGLIDSQRRVLARLDQATRARAVTEIARSLSGLEARKEEVEAEFAPVLS
jgi:hypothetical protein